MDKEQNKQSVDKVWWRTGVTMFVQASGWIAFPVIIALFLGRWLDNKYASEPFYFLVLTMGAFVISSIGITLTGIKYMKQIEQEEKKLKDSQKIKKN